MSALDMSDLESPIPLQNIEAARFYLTAGLSVFPLTPRAKTPQVRWAPYQKRRPTEQEITDWFSENPKLGVAVVCGEVSEGLVCLDADDDEFSAWLDNLVSRSSLARAWVNQSGSGKLHVFVQSRSPVYTTQLRVGPRKLADIRGWGHGSAGPSYVALPPTTHPSGRRYCTISGDPRFLPRLDDAMALFTFLASRFTGSPLAPKEGDKRVLPAIQGDDAGILLERVRGLGLPGKILRAIETGGVPGEGEWANCPANDHSFIGYAVAFALREKGLGAEEIENIFATFPIGEATYANVARPHHGWSWLIGTNLRRIDEQIKEQQQAAQRAAGENFIVRQVICIQQESPLFEITVTRLADDKQEMSTSTFLVSHEELLTSRGFEAAVSRSMLFIPIHAKPHQGREYKRFANLVMAMASLEAVPRGATASGHLRALIVSRLVESGEIRSGPPPSPQSFYMGWTDAGLMYVRGRALISILNLSTKPAPGPERVWSVLRSLGAVERRIAITADHSEMLWIIPEASLAR